jgi:hypothetical protein
MKHQDPTDFSKGSPINEFLNDTYYKNEKTVPEIVGMVLGTKVALTINSPEIAEDIFVAKNKYFDKHPKTADIVSRLVGDSIMFAKSDMKWQ